ncbi:MAG: GIY-YIG nuclease family protein [Proteobacteria bacterium]|nr:GIY-YIG nuclease family protein [Pseudomonadota bacterium]
MSKSYMVYILTNQKNGTLYIGVTSNPARRDFEHKNKIFEGFSKKYGLTKIVYYEVYDDPIAAITREKQMKAWKRAWKIKTIEEINPEWRDLSLDFNR